MLRRRCIMISAFFIYTAAVFCAAIFLSSTGLFEYKKDVLSDSRAVADDFGRRLPKNLMNFIGNESFGFGTLSSRGPIIEHNLHVICSRSTDNCIDGKCLVFFIYNMQDDNASVFAYLTNESCLMSVNPIKPWAVIKYLDDCNKE